MKRSLLMLAAALLLPVLGAEESFGPPQKGPMPPPPPPGSAPQKFRHGPGLWRIFSRLTPEERRELMELQRKDPERYRQVVQQKLEELYRKEAEERRQFEDLVRRCRNSKEEKEKAALTAELRKMTAAKFHARLAENRRNLEEHRRRLERMTKELARRTANADAIIDAQVKRMLDGGPGPFPPPREGPFSAGGPKRPGERPPAN